MRYNLPFNVIGTWGFTILMTSLLIGIWFIMQPAFTYVTIVMGDSMDDMGISNSSTDNIIALLRLGINIVIPITIVGLWGWALATSQRREWRGY